MSFTMNIKSSCRRIIKFYSVLIHGYSTCRIGHMKNFTKFTGKQLQWACSFTKTGLHNVCCPVNFVKFLIFDKSAVYYQYDSLFP